MLSSPATRPYDSQSRSVPASHFYSGLTGRSYQTEFGAWKQSFLQKITTGSGIASTLGTSLGMNLAMRGISPVLMKGVARLGIRAPLPAMLVSTTALSMLTSGGMTLFSRLTQGIPADQSFLDQWRVSLLYSLPAMMMSRVAIQRWGWGTTILQDAAMEPIQAVASVALSCGMGGVGWLPETNMTVGQLFTRELTEGFFYMGVGRGMGEAVDRAASQVPCSLGLLNGPVPSRILSPEAGLIGDSPPNIKELLGLNLEAADRLSGFLETHRRTGGELEGVELTFKRVRDGAEEKHAIIDGDTMHAIADGMTDSVPLRFILVNSPEAWKGPGHPEVRNGRGQMGALEAYWFLKDLSDMHDNHGRVVLYRTDAHRRPIATVLVQTKAGNWIDLNRAMVESGHAHVYIIMPDATGMSTEFVGLQQAAQREGIGIWQYPQYQGGLHISSVRTMRDEGLGGDQVMVRIFNTTDKALNLGDYKIRNGPREEPIPDFTLLPGQGVRLLLDSTEYNNNSNAEFVVGLMHDKPEGTPRFELDRDHPVLLVTRGTEERIATVFYSNGTAAERVSDGFRHQRAEGLHLIAFNPLQHISGFEDVKENIRLYNNSDEPIDVSHWALQQEGAVRLTLPEGTVLPPYRGVQIFTCSGKNRSDPAGDLELYLGETKKKQRIWNNDLPMNLLNPAGEIISMEAGNAKARKLIPAKFLRRKGAVVPAGHESGDFATLIA